MSVFAHLAWRFVKGKVGYEDIMRLEGLFQVKFPELYTAMVLACHGGRPQPNRFDTEHAKGYVFKSLLPITNRYASNMMDVHAWIGDRLPAGCIPFASDPSGNYICFDFMASSREPLVVLWNHETGKCEGTAKSIEQFMLHLY